MAVLFISVVLVMIQVLLGCDHARMKDQESIRTYEAEPPEMPAGTIPVSGGSELIKAFQPDALRNPLPGTRDIQEKGRMAYHYFCIACHGQHLDGNGTVGQSFAPLPTHLKAPYVREQGDGRLFYRISFGYKRHPPLAGTMSEEDRWAVIHYIRSVQ